jgi:hypothetical protein
MRKLLTNLASRRHYGAASEMKEVLDKLTAKNWKKSKARLLASVARGRGVRPPLMVDVACEKS